MKKQLQKRRRRRRDIAWDNAKENRRKRAEAAQAAAQAEERKLSCLVEGHAEVMEALDYAARPTMTKATRNGHFVN